jgi:hypothetical protein
LLSSHSQAEEYTNGVWAHALPAPEPGCLLARRPFAAELLQSPGPIRTSILKAAKKEMLESITSSTGYLVTVLSFSCTVWNVVPLSPARHAHVFWNDIYPRLVTSVRHLYYFPKCTCLQAEGGMTTAESNKRFEAWCANGAYMYRMSEKIIQRELNTIIKAASVVEKNPKKALELTEAQINFVRRCVWPNMLCACALHQRQTLGSLIYVRRTIVVCLEDKNVTSSKKTNV